MPAETGIVTEVRLFHAHVPCQLSHLFEHASTWYGLVDARMGTLGYSLWPPTPQIKYDISTCTSYTLYGRCGPALRPSGMGHIHYIMHGMFVK
jgi:hypothetical protein